MANGTVLNDVLHEDSIGENVLLYKDPHHQWCYLSDQDEDDLIVFCNVNSRGQRASKR